MVTEMTKYDFILMSGDADAFLEKLQAVGVMDITRSLKPVDEKSEKLSNRAEIYRKALVALKEVEPAEFAEKTYGDIAVNVLETVKGKEEALSQLAQLDKAHDESLAWGRFNVNDIKRLADLGLRLHFYKAKTSALDPVWKEQYALSEIATEGNYTYFVVVSDQEGCDFPMKELPAPEKDCGTLEKEIAALRDDIEKKDRHLAELKCHEGDLRAEMNRIAAKLDLHLAHEAGEKAAEDYVTVFEGFAPADKEAALRAMLDQELVFYAIDKAKVDDNGSIVLDSAVFFETGKSEIKAEGKALLDRFIPVYLDVLLSSEYSDYLGEIIIEGHTDSTGSYVNNLKLSQQRALQVALYCLNMPSLTSSQKDLLRQILTATGRSWADLKYDEDGNEDAEASRRVEFKFSLKDADMIEEMNRILRENDLSGSEGDA